MTCIVFQNDDLAKAILKEIAVCEIRPVWLHFSPVEEANQIPHLVGMDGRAAVDYRWGDEEVAWLQDYITSYLTENSLPLDSVQVVAKLPVDWQWPEGD
jgi:hypothetical protein